MGLSGTAACRLLEARGVPKSEIATFDAKAGAAQFSDPAQILTEARPRTLVVSPGVPLASPWIRDFAASGGHITSELALALEHLTSEKVLGITGSVGKSTTVALLEAGLKRFSPDSFVGGNIGRPLADYAADLLEKKRKVAPWVVIELSSYQLENAGALSCEHSAITYFTANHLERYPDIASYYDTKWGLVGRTRGKIVLNKRGGELEAYAKKKGGTGKFLFTDGTDPVLQVHDLKGAKLLGAHNQDNLAIAAKLAELCGWPAHAFQGFREFTGLAHRMENLGEARGVLVVNDSKATTIESVRTAIEGLLPAVPAQAKLWVLLGGKDKNLPWQELASLGRQAKLGFIFFGDCGAKAQRLSGLQGETFPQLAPAVESVASQAKKGDTLLLSPGGTSLDEFKNFEQRGERFAEYVKRYFG